VAKPLEEKDARAAFNDLLDRKNTQGVILMNLFDVVLLVNILNTMASTIPEVDANEGASETVFCIEMGCTFFFILQYVMIISGRGPGELFKPMRILDFVCLTPGLLLVYFKHIFYNQSAGQTLHHQLDYQSQVIENIIEVSMLLRVLRLLDHPALRRTMMLLTRSSARAFGNLGVPLCFSLYVWVISAGIFTWTETYTDGLAQKELSSIPSSMYWTSIFLVGEWSLIDFSGAGSILCIFFCIFGIMVFAIPVGVIGEAMHSTIVQVTQ